MLQHPAFDPVAFKIGPLKVHWYGLMYLIGFVVGWWLGRRRARESWRGFTPESMDDVLFYVVLGVVLGGRVGYVLFYGLDRFLADPLFLFQIQNGGMSFHGGLLGVILAMMLFARRRGMRFFQVADFIAPLVPPGLLAGRMGNFINGNLWGRPTELPWAMVFPKADALGRHPSQLYEALLEGVVLFLIVWLYSRAPRPLGAVSGMFLVCYAVFRFLVEFVRDHVTLVGYLGIEWLTMGQLLCLPMFAFGVALMVRAARHGTIADARG
ncbi:MAG: prolipoprotein diacylglyceryl transferase [Gammaproteobacteria bacterium]|nr:prolipoprotein diacylglyceryl transferase [Gammaproteobacteria bacterium]